MHNSAQWIRQAVESCLSQSWPDVEIIVVDDGSTDDSLGQIEDFGDRIKIIRQNQKGSNFARNAALNEAQGEWIQFLDADDYLLPGKLQNQLSQSAASQADVIFSPVEILHCNEDGTESRSIYPKHNEQDLALRWINWELSQTGTLLWRTKALKEIGGWNEDYPCCQDNELCLRALKHSLKFHYVKSVDAVYRMWSSRTLSNRNRRKTIGQRTRLFREALAWLTESRQLKPIHQQAISTTCFRLARSIANHNLREGNLYFRSCKDDGLIQLGQTANCSTSFRLTTQFFGFANAERLASVFRFFRFQQPNG